MCNIYNYADDNTISCYGNNIDEVCTKLKPVTSILMNWFQENNMQANPAKFESPVGFVRRSVSGSTIVLEGIV